MIPETFTHLTSLQLLYFNSNQFTGTIPRTLLSMPNVTYIGLSYNKLSGTIPDWYVIPFASMWVYRTILSLSCLTVNIAGSGQWVLYVIVRISIDHSLSQSRNRSCGVNSLTLSVSVHLAGNSLSGTYVCCRAAIALLIDWRRCVRAESLRRSVACHCIRSSYVLPYLLPVPSDWPHLTNQRMPSV